MPNSIRKTCPLSSNTRARARGHAWHTATVREKTRFAVAGEARRAGPLCARGGREEPAHLIENRSLTQCGKPYGEPLRGFTTGFTHNVQNSIGFQQANRAGAAAAAADCLFNYRVRDISPLRDARRLRRRCLDLVRRAAAPCVSLVASR